MTNKVLIGLILLVLIWGAFGAAGCNSSVTEEEEAPPVSETPVPDVSTPDEEDVDEGVNEDMNETGAMSTSTFVRKIENGEYEWPYRDIVVTVSGTVRSLEDLYYQIGTMEGPWDGYYIEFEPNQGFIVQWEFTQRNYDFEKIKILQSGQKVVVRGYLASFNEWTKKVTMGNCRLVKAY